MPLITILIDALAFGIYLFQRENQLNYIFLGGIFIQAILSVLLIYISFLYKGKKYTNIHPEMFVKYFSFRYTVIVVSAFINSVALLLYILNLLGINSLIFN